MQQERSFERRRSFAIKIHQANHKILHLPFITKDILKTDTTIKQINIAWPYLYIGISLWKKLILERINHMPLGIKIGVSTKDPLMLRPFEEEKKESNLSHLTFL